VEDQIGRADQFELVDELRQQVGEDVGGHGRCLPA
jgi:hypothetical protein